MYKSRHFKIEELVPPETIEYYEARGGKHRAWELFDDEAILCLDLLRDDLGSCTINNWLWGGNLRYSGFRPASCDVGSDYSMHRVARGFDVKFKHKTVEEVRAHIKANPERFRWIKRMELGQIKNGKKCPISWNHIDNGNVAEFKEFWA